jgi:hypothetical protein
MCCLPTCQPFLFDVAAVRIEESSDTTQIVLACHLVAVARLSPISNCEYLGGHRCRSEDHVSETRAKIDFSKKSS